MPSDGGSDSGSGGGGRGRFVKPAPSGGPEATADTMDGSAAGATLPAPATTAPPPAAPGPADYPALVPLGADHYVVGRELARGGMGRILSARDRRLGRTVALKTLVAADADLAARFEREARITARLEHPAIVPVHEAGRLPGGEPFYAMKLVSGRPLDQVIASARTLAERLALLPRVIDVVDAVAYAHSQRVIHRDLKPQNVLVGAFGETVVLDWGLAKDLTRDGDDPRPGAARPAADGETVAGAVMGTPSYMAPEQAAGQPVDERADVFALGALLYHFLAGAPPYVGRNTAEVLAAVESGPPPPLEEHAPGVPRDLATIVRRAMAREPGERPTSRELAELLRQFQTGKLVASHEYTFTELLRRWLRRYRAVIGIATAAALALLVLAAVSMRRIVRERDRADRERAWAEREREDADQQRKAAAELATSLLVERGREELLAGNPRRAAVLLAQAYGRSATPAPALRLMMREALRAMDAEGLVLRPAETARFGRDGRRVTTSRDQETVIWDAATGAKLATLPAGSGALWLSPAGDLVVTPFYSPRVFDATTGAELARLRGDMGTDVEGTPERCAFTADGTRVVTVDHRTPLISEVRTGRVVFETPAHDLLADSVCLSPDGSRLAIGRLDHHEGSGTIDLWDTASGRLVFSVEADWPKALGFLPDGRLLGARGHDLVLLDPRTGKPVYEVKGETVYNLAFAPGSARVVGGNDNVELRDATTGERTAVLPATIGKQVAVAFSEDGALLATGGEDGTVRVWDAATGELLGSLPGHRGPISALHFSADGTKLASASEDETARVWTVPAGAPRLGGGDALAVTAGGDRAALSHWHDPPSIVDVATGRTISRLAHRPVPADEMNEHTIDDFTVIGFVDGGRGLVSYHVGDVVAEAALWDTASGEKRLVLGDAQPFAVNSAGTRIAVDADDHLALLDGTGRPVRRLAGTAPRRVTTAAFSPDGQLLCAWRDGIVDVWNVESGALVHSVKTPSDLAVNDSNPNGADERLLRFAADGVHLATPNGMVDLRQGTFTPFATPVIYVLAVSGDGGRVVTTRQDSGRTVVELRAGGTDGPAVPLPVGFVKAAAFAGGDAFVITVGDDGAAVWDAASGRRLATLPARLVVAVRGTILALRPDRTLGPFEPTLEDRPAAEVEGLVTQRAGWSLGADGVLIPGAAAPR